MLGALDALDATTAVAAPEDAALIRASRRAMATTFELVLPCGLPCALEAAHEGLDVIDRVEDQLTVYRESEIIRLNCRAPREPVPVDDELFQLLELAQRIGSDTGGAFNLGSGGLTKLWGFHARNGRVPALGELEQVLARFRSGRLSLDPKRQTVCFKTPEFGAECGFELNFGSIGKGHALDCVVARWQSRWTIHSALLHGGHSSVYAIGSEPGARGGWSVGIKHPWDPERRLAVIRLCNQGLGTSAATFQHFEHEGRRLGHILDPRTGWPAEGMASASVVAPSAAEADALATAFFVLGVESSREYCEAHPGIGAVLLADEPDARPIAVGIAQDRIELMDTAA